MQRVLFVLLFVTLIFYWLDRPILTSADKLAADPCSELQVVKEELAFEKKMREQDAQDLQYLRTTIDILQASAMMKDPTIQGPSQPSEEAVKRYFDELEKGCYSTRAVFKKRLLIGWVLHVPDKPDSVERPIRFLFKKHRNEIKQAIERIGAGQNVPYAEVLHYLGEC